MGGWAGGRACGRAGVRACVCVRARSVSDWALTVLLPQVSTSTRPDLQSSGQTAGTYPVFFGSAFASGNCFGTVRGRDLFHFKRNMLGKA